MAIVVALAALGAPAGAQPAPPPVREVPLRLAAGADSNDAFAYHAHAVRHDVSWAEAYAAYARAWQLRPDVAEFLAAQYNTIWMAQPEDWRYRYWANERSAWKAPAAAVLDSLSRTMARIDPMVHLEFPCDAPTSVARRRDDASAAFAYYIHNCYEQAIERYAGAIAKHPDRRWMRLRRAHAFYRLKRYDEAVADLEAVRDAIAAEEAKTLEVEWETAAWFEYAIGMVRRRQGNLDLAQAAFRAALERDLSMYMAHWRLADIAVARHDHATALAEYGLAAELEPGDGVLRHVLGSLLATARRYAEAEPHLREAVRLQPAYAQARFSHAAALDALGRGAEAREAYEAFLARAPASAAAIGTATRRVAELSAAAP